MDKKKEQQNRLYKNERDEWRGHEVHGLTRINTMFMSIMNKAVFS